MKNVDKGIISRRNLNPVKKKCHVKLPHNVNRLL